MSGQEGLASDLGGHGTMLTRGLALRMGSRVRGDAGSSPCPAANAQAGPQRDLAIGPGAAAPNLQRLTSLLSFRNVAARWSLPTTEDRAP